MNTRRSYHSFNHYSVQEKFSQQPVFGFVGDFLGPIFLHLKTLLHLELDALTQFELLYL